MERIINFIKHLFRGLFKSKIKQDVFINNEIDFSEVEANNYTFKKRYSGRLPYVKAPSIK